MVKNNEGGKEGRMKQGKKEEWRRERRRKRGRRRRLKIEEGRNKK